MRKFDPPHLALWIMFAILIAIGAYLYFWSPPRPILRIQMDGTSQSADASSPRLDALHNGREVVSVSSN